jgi:hypothetical protein
LNPYAPPSLEADVSEREEPHGFWREGTMLVVSRSSVRLPDRCVRCNGPALGYRSTQTVHWYRGWFSRLPLFNLLLIPFLRESLTLDLGLCPKHRKQRVAGHALIALGLAAPALFGLGLPWSPAMLLFGGGILGGLELVRSVRAGRMQDDCARIRVGSEFLLSVPSRLPGRPPPDVSKCA